MLFFKNANHEKKTSSDMPSASAGTVSIKMPDKIVQGSGCLMAVKDATVFDKNGKMLWRGVYGETASFNVEKTTAITINLGSWANLVSGKVSAGKRYTLVRDSGFHMLAEFILSEEASGSCES